MIAAPVIVTPEESMTIDELRTKFDALAGPIMSETRRDQLRETIFALENLDDVAKLMALTAENSAQA